MGNWAVICGALRAPLEVTIVVNYLLELRETGLLDGIILSTWRESVRDNPELIQELGKRGIIVSETIDVKEGGNGQTYRQHRLFEQGLSLCPPRSLVFKVRTDKCAHRIARFVPFLKRGLVPVGSELEHYCAFKNKIVLQAQSVSMPFNHSDIAFLGQREDLLTLTHMDLYYDWTVFPGSANAEIRWFSRPFVKKLPIFREFFEKINCRALSAKIVANARREEPIELPELVNRSLAAHIWVASQNFEIAGPPAGDNSIHFRQLFGGKATEEVAVIPMTLTEHAAILKGGVLEKVLAGKLTGGAPAKALCKAINDLRNPELSYQLFEADRLEKVREFVDGDRTISGDLMSSVRTATTVKRPVGKANTPLSIVSALGLDLPEDELTTVVQMIAEDAKKEALTSVYVRLARAYKTGQGVPKRNDRYIFWLRLAGGEKHVESCLELGRIYEAEGSLKEAAYWYREAALRNNIFAQDALGKLLKLHPDLPESERAQEWLNRAESGRDALYPA